MALVPCQVLRAAILLSYCSILCNYKAIDMPAHQTYGGSWKFLTFIDLVIQAVFFGICVLTDLSSLLTRGNDSQEQERQLKKLISLRDWMMAVLAFPVGVFVVTMFWSIYIYDRELVYPKLLDNFIPAWLNHGMVQVISIEKSEKLISGTDVRLIAEEQLLRYSMQKRLSLCEKHACPKAPCPGTGIWREQHTQFSVSPVLLSTQAHKRRSQQ
ncbi:androgen-induced gene 1 protein isoform X2 [Neopelma chrysocephalum]|uniref:androgen-induced gene 1 protein isoform X2 n=1 Tax=Neopelma chrysocephalum TaxID=114329 RepID=UPI000FCD3355|nr:androgen-induced gene 1 protein isoform X2 [Neopelma chrysocephalum]